MSSAKRNWKRPDKSEHYFNRAKVAAERGTCLRRRIGAIIIKDGVEISSGYAGSPRGMDHCIDIGKCLRIQMGIPSGERYELCRSVHAEQNAIINAARTGVNITGGEIYISSEKIKSGYSQRSKQRRKIYGPCMICKKEIINAGLKAVHMREEGVGVRIHTLEQIKKLLQKEQEALKSYFKHSKSK